MSRIHEALKKAEQGRGTGPAPETATPFVAPEAIQNVNPAATQAPFPTQGMPQEILIAESPAAPITLETLMARCVRHAWNPDSKNLFFANSHNHVHGAEEFRTLRSRLYQIRDRQPLRTVLIASVLPGEGKTFTTANLAQAIVRQHGRRALIIDADLRRSQLHTRLGAPSTPGLTDYLSGEADEFSIIQRGPMDNLFFIPGGKSASNPLELLSNGRMKILLERLAPIFDWVLMDSPPVVAVSDAGLLADLCDGAVLVVKAASTPFDVALKAREELRKKGLLGVVLNHVDPGDDYLSQYYSYYHKHPNGTQSRG